MKKSFISTVLLLLLVLVSSGLSAQAEKNQTKSQRKLEKERLKHEQATKDSMQQLVYTQLLTSKYYMIGINHVMADAYQASAGRQGVENTTLSSMTNFIYVIGDSVILQVASPAYVGSNGVGGFTMKGIIQDYRFKPPKSSDKPTYISFKVKSHYGVETLMVNITIFSEGRAEVSFGSSGYNLQGNLLDPDDAKFVIGSDLREHKR